MQGSQLLHSQRSSQVWTMESRSRGIKIKEREVRQKKDTRLEGAREQDLFCSSRYQEELQRAIKSVGLGDPDCSRRTSTLVSMKG